MRLYVDDCLIYQPVYSTIDHQVLQEDLYYIRTYQLGCNITVAINFNVNKCSILQLFKHHHKSLFPYSMSGKFIKTIEQHFY